MLITSNTLSTSISIGLVQISSDFISHYYLPYSVGILQAYVEKHHNSSIKPSFLPILYKREKIEQSVQKLLSADIVGFSSYLWNEQTSLEIAKELKAKNPNVIVVFGGPQVPNYADDYLREHRFIDLCCQGEGEIPFLSILHNFEKRDWKQVPSISFLDQGDNYIKNSIAPRISDLSEVPSPFLQGSFDLIMQLEKDREWIATWETNRGCPYSCSFCDFGSATASKVRTRDIAELESEIDWFASHKIEYLFCADANVGMLPRDIDIALLLEKARIKTGFPRSISVESAKNVSIRSLEVQKILNRCGLSRGTVLSMQTLNPSTLQAIERSNIPLQAYHDAQQWCSREGISTMSDLILGLPEETYHSFTTGICTLIEKGQHNRIQFNTLCILPNAAMGQPQYIKKYGFKLQDIPIVNQHGLIKSASGIEEFQTVVVASNAMSENDWIKSKAYCWLCSLFYFDKLLQIPLIILKEAYDLSYNEIFEYFIERNFSKYNIQFPILDKIINDFFIHATAISNGAAEYKSSEERLGIWWPVDEYILIDICLSDKLELFYKEFQIAVELLLSTKKLKLKEDLISEAIKLNMAAFKTPNLSELKSLKLSWNIYDFYQAIILGTQLRLEKAESTYSIDMSAFTWASNEEWMKKVIWYQNKTGGYLYPIHKIEEC